MWYSLNPNTELKRFVEEGYGNLSGINQQGSAHEQKEIISQLQHIVVHLYTGPRKDRF